jgi:hypothetical protein
MAQTSPASAKRLIYVSWCPSCPSSKKVWQAIETNLLSWKQTSALLNRDRSPSDQNSSEGVQGDIDRCCFAWRDANAWAVDHGRVDIDHVVRECRLAIVLYSATYGSDHWCRQVELMPLLKAGQEEGRIRLVWLQVAPGDVPSELAEITPLIKYGRTLWSTANRSQSAVAAARALMEAWTEADVFAQHLAEERFAEGRAGLPGGESATSQSVNGSHLAIVIEPTEEAVGNRQHKPYIYALYRRIAGSDVYEMPHDSAASLGQICGDYPYPWVVEQPASSAEPVRLICPILERYLLWAQQQPEPFVVEIFAPDELLDQDWSQLHVPAGEERQWLIHGHPFLLLARSRLLSCHAHKSDYLAHKFAGLSRGTGHWIEADGLTKSHRFKPVMRGKDQVALRWNGPMAADRSEGLKGVVHSMVPLAVWPRHPVEADALITSLVTLGLSDPATGRPRCPDLDEFARKRWENAEDIPIDCTVVVDHPARRPPSLLDRQQPDASKTTLYISA